MIDVHDPLFLNEIRKGHCSRKGQEHACAGTCSITPGGLKLDCPLCGDASEELAPPLNSWGLEVAREVLQAAGMDFHVLTPERQRLAVNAVGRLRCPGCESVHAPRADRSLEVIRCGCAGWDFDTWRRVWVKRRPA